jgi:hypothetical protein
MRLGLQVAGKGIGTLESEKKNALEIGRCVRRRATGVAGSGKVRRPLRALLAMRWQPC